MLKKKPERCALVLFPNNSLGANAKRLHKPLEFHDQRVDQNRVRQKLMSTERRGECSDPNNDDRDARREDEEREEDAGEKKGDASEEQQLQPQCAQIGERLLQRGEPRPVVFRFLIDVADGDLVGCERPACHRTVRKSRCQVALFGAAVNGQTPVEEWGRRAERQKRTRAQVPEVVVEIRAGVHQRGYHLEVHLILTEAVRRRSGRPRAHRSHDLIRIIEHLGFEVATRPVLLITRNVHVLEELFSSGQLARRTFTYTNWFRVTRIQNVHKEQIPGKNNNSVALVEKNFYKKLIIRAIS